jgi:hypothetical protein
MSPPTINRKPRRQQWNLLAPCGCASWLGHAPDGGTGSSISLTVSQSRSPPDPSTVSERLHHACQEDSFRTRGGAFVRYRARFRFCNPRSRRAGQRVVIGIEPDARAAPGRDGSSNQGVCLGEAHQGRQDRSAEARTQPTQCRPALGPKMNVMKRRRPCSAGSNHA